MKKLLFLLLCIISTTLSAQNTELNYIVGYSFVKCAEINVKISENNNNIKISAVGKSCGLADLVVKVDEQYDCYIDKDDDFLPLKIEKVSKSKDSVFNINLDFDRENNIVTNSIAGSYKIVPNTYDFVSALLLIMENDFFKEQTERQINLFFDNSPCILNVKFCGYKTVDDIDCKKIELKIINNQTEIKTKKFLSLIPTNSTHYLWVSNSQPSILVCAKISLIAGSLKIDLKKMNRD
jgi:hypothetical protein